MPRKPITIFCARKPSKTCDRQSTREARRTTSDVREPAQDESWMLAAPSAGALSPAADKPYRLTSGVAFRFKERLSAYAQP